MHLNRSKLFLGNIRIAIAVIVLLPLFFQLSKGLFRESTVGFNSGGSLFLLPIPISVIACYVGIVLLGGYRRATISMGFIFITCILMIVSLILGTEGSLSQDKEKFMLLLQYILPMSGLVLGQLYMVGDALKSATMEKAFIYTLAVIVPLQLLSTWLQGTTTLTSYVYAFSIYQHFQYVPVIFVSAFLVALFRLWLIPPFRYFLFLMLILMSIYVTASQSLLALFMLFVGLLGFSFYQLKKYSDKIPMLFLLIGALVMCGYFTYVRKDVGIKFNFLNIPVAEYSNTPIEKIVPNLTERVNIWGYYVENITSDYKTFLTGHSKPPERAQYPSAHNYYLDLLYNFGFLALLPLFLALLCISIMLCRFRNNIYHSPGLIGLAAVVIFLLIIDNSLKVGLRQPYAGIFSFFLIGALISRFTDMNIKQLNNSKTENILE